MPVKSISSEEFLTFEKQNPNCYVLNLPSHMLHRIDCPHFPRKESRTGYSDKMTSESRQELEEWALVNSGRACVKCSTCIP